MSYDLRIMVKAEGCDAYPIIATPEYDNPTYNLGEMFRACMDWSFRQSEKYKCDFAIDKITQGLSELRSHRKSYEKYNPCNGWGDIDSAIDCLESLQKCIYEQAEEVPLNCLYMAW